MSDVAASIVPATIEIPTVNVGTPTVLADAKGERIYSAIAKHPVPTGTVLWLSIGNLTGDAQADLSVHGGPDKAVYAYPSEHLAEWGVELDEELGDAPFGENLSTVGVRESDVGIGDVWRWGDAVLQVCQPRWPCFKLALHRRRADVQVRMRATGRSGWYLRVLQPGEVTVGDPATVTHPDRSGLTVADAVRAMNDRHLDDVATIQALVAHPALSDEWRAPLSDKLAR